MICKECNSKYEISIESPLKVRFCPVCGSNINEAIVLDSLGSVLVKLENDYSVEVFNDKRKSLALFQDLAPRLSKEKDLLDKLLSVCKLEEVYNFRDKKNERKALMKQIFVELEKEFWLNNQALKLVEEAVDEFCGVGVETKSIANAVDFENPVIEEAVRKKLTDMNHKIGDFLTIEDIEMIEDLDLSAEKLMSIRDLSIFCNLKELNIAFNNISDISPLGNLRKLEKLNLSTNIKLSDHLDTIKSIFNLNQLKSLDLSSCCLYDSDIEGIGKLKSLTKLDLSYNRIKDIVELKSLVNLRVLLLNGNQISDISGLCELPSLHSLFLRYNNIKVVDGLNNLSELRHIGLNKNQLCNITGLVNLRKLDLVDLSDNPYDENQLIDLEKIYRNICYGALLLDGSNYELMGMVISLYNRGYIESYNRRRD